MNTAFATSVRHPKLYEDRLGDSYPPSMIAIVTSKVVARYRMYQSVSNNYAKVKPQSFHFEHNHYNNTLTLFSTVPLLSIVSRIHHRA